MTAIWCEFAWLEHEEATPSVFIEIDGDRIATVTAGAEAPPGAVRIPGLTLPGMANSHSHAFHRALRGRTHGGAGDFWTWRDEMYRLAATLDPDGYHELARRTFTEMRQAGYTLVGEFHYLHHDLSGRPYGDPNAMGRAVMAAAADAGIRLTMLDALYSHGGLEGGGYTEAQGVQRRFVETPQQWRKRIYALDADGAVRLGAAVHSVRAVDPAGVAAASGWAAMAGAPLHAHVSEQPAENEQCLARHGLTPVQLLAAAGAVSDRFTAVHGTHLTAGDIERLGSARSFVAFCPTTERDLADGIGPSVALTAAGACLTLGSDSHAVIDPFEEMRALELNQRLATRQRGNHSVAVLLTAATSAGYASLGWADGGRIAAGMLADLVTVGLDSVRLAGTAAQHLLGSVVFAASPEDVTMVMVGGQRR